MEEQAPRKVYTKFRKENRCRFCRDGITQIDYKDLNSLMKLVSQQGKIFSRRRTGNCAWHQRSAQKAIRRARFLALMPFVGGSIS
jgi:small subunit ribosomal protein S18